MKTLNTIALSLLLLLAACTHNDGDIGPWFGLWHLESIECDGVKVDDYQQDVFFAFQSSVFQMQRVDGMHTTEQTFAQWTTEGQMLTIAFVDTRFAPLTGLPGFDVNTTFNYHFAGNASLTLTTQPNTHTFTYHLTKYPD